MEDNYMILFSRGVRVPLLAENGTYTLKFENHEITMPSYIEQWMTCDLWQGYSNIENFCWWIRTYYDSNISIKDLKLAVSAFLKEHYRTPISNFKVGDIPTYANEDKEMFIVLPDGYTESYITIDESIESYWLEGLFDNKKVCYQDLRDKIEVYLADYGYVLTRSPRMDAVGDVADSFLKQHGMYSRQDKICIHRSISDSMWGADAPMFDILLTIGSIPFGAALIWLAVTKDGSFFMKCFAFIGGLVMLLGVIATWFGPKPKEPTTDWL